MKSLLEKIVFKDCLLFKQENINKNPSIINILWIKIPLKKKNSFFLFFQNFQKFEPGPM